MSQHDEQNSVDRRLAGIRARAVRSMPELPLEARKVAEDVAKRHFPGLVEAIFAGQNAAFMARSLGVSRATRDAVLPAAELVERLGREGEVRALAAGADPTIAGAICALADYWAERFRIDREVGLAFQEEAEKATEVRVQVGGAR